MRVQRQDRFAEVLSLAFDLWFILIPFSNFAEQLHIIKHKNREWIGILYI